MWSAKLIFARRARQSILVKAGPGRKIDFRAPGAKINFGIKKIIMAMMKKKRSSIISGRVRAWIDHLGRGLLIIRGQLIITIITIITCVVPGGSEMRISSH